MSSFVGSRNVKHYRFGPKKKKKSKRNSSVLEESPFRKKTGSMQHRVNSRIHGLGPDEGGAFSIGHSGGKA